MSWTDIFPVLDDDLLARHRAGVTAAEREEFETHFGVETQDCKTQDARQESFARGKGSDAHREPLQGPSQADAEAVPLSSLECCVLPSCVSAPPARRHIVSATLFWKHANGRDPDLPQPTRELLVDARRMGRVKRFAPWDSYVAPLLLHTRAAVERHPEVVFRLYLPTP